MDDGLAEAATRLLRKRRVERKGEIFVSLIKSWEPRFSAMFHSERRRTEIRYYESDEQFNLGRPLTLRSSGGAM